jgi:hypothetical protein
MPSREAHPFSPLRSQTLAVDRRAEAPVVSRPKAAFLLAATRAGAGRASRREA